MCRGAESVAGDLSLPGVAAKESSCFDTAAGSLWGLLSFIFLIVR
jgi:hypothetical protein